MCGGVGGVGGCGGVGGVCLQTFLVSWIIWYILAKYSQFILGLTTKYCLIQAGPDRVYSICKIVQGN